MNLTETHFLLERGKMADLLLRSSNSDFSTEVQPIVTHMTPIFEEFRLQKHSGKKSLINITTSIVE